MERSGPIAGQSTEQRRGPIKNNQSGSPCYVESGGFGHVLGLSEEFE